MSGLIIYGLMAALLFVTAFITKRRIGAPILGLAAGYIISNFWASDIVALVEDRGVDFDSVFVSGLVVIAVALTPALLLMVHGGVHKSAIQRFFAAAAFTFVGLAFLIEPLYAMVVAGGITDRLSDFYMQYQGAIIAVGLVGAVIDLVFTKLHKPVPQKGKH